MTDNAQRSGRQQLQEIVQESRRLQAEVTDLKNQLASYDARFEPIFELLTVLGPVLSQDSGANRWDLIKGPYKRFMETLETP